MSLKHLDPLQVKRNACSKKHACWAGFDILNEVPVFVILYDYLVLDQPKKLWANAPWLDHIGGQSLEQFQAYDFAASVSSPIKKAMHVVGRSVQERRQFSNMNVNMYPRDKPMPALVMHQPILIQESDRPLILASQFNDFAVPIDKATGSEPLNFLFQGEICTKVHSFEALDLLDELPCYFALFDFNDPARPQQLWASFALLDKLGKTLEEYTSAAFLDVTPSTIAQHASSILQQVQTIFRPILLGSTRPMVLCTFVPPDPKARHQLQSERATSVFEKQVMYLLDEGATVFDVAPTSRIGTALWSNFHTARQYNLGYDCTHILNPDGKAFSLRTVLQSFEWGDDDEAAALWQALVALPFDAQPLVKTCRKRRADGAQPEWHKLTFAPCRNPLNGERCLLLLEADVSSLMRAQAELQASNDLKDQFLMCVSHELRTPLSGIIGLSSAISGSPQCPPSMRPALRTIDHSAQLLNSLVTDILETSECMAKSFRLNLRRVNFAATCERVCDVTSAMTARGRPKLKEGVVLRNCLLGRSDFVIEADEERLHKVLWHLLDNAAKFTSEGWIEVAGQLEDGEGGQMLRVDVTDTGCGISQAMLGRVWEVFQQGDMSATRAHGGTGLGLALVKLIVNAHGGRVHVRSEQRGAGWRSTFSLWVPARGSCAVSPALANLEVRGGRTLEGSGGERSEREGGGSGGGGGEEQGRGSEKKEGTEEEEEEERESRERELAAALRRKTRRVEELEAQVRTLEEEKARAHVTAHVTHPAPRPGSASRLRTCRPHARRRYVSGAVARLLRGCACDCASANACACTRVGGWVGPRVRPVLEAASDVKGAVEES